MNIALVLTNDWELFGDGSGDYFSLQHEPLENLLGLMDNFNAKITIMAETGQQRAMLELADKYDELKKISRAWEEVLKEVISKNSDVQLHYHPQWNNAKYQGGEWHLDMDNWALSSLKPEEICNVFNREKAYLEKLLREVNPLYQCQVFRAGAYCIQPAKEAIKCMKKQGFICDTSVTKGYVSEGFYNFKNAYSNIIPWHTNSDCVSESGGKSEGVLELPIYSETGPDSQALKKYLPGLYYKMKFGVSPDKSELEWANERDRVKSRKYPASRRFYKKNQKKNLNFYRKAILSNNAIQLDYDYLPATVFVKMLKNILNSKQLANYRRNNITIPVVASGHVKDMHNTDNLKRIFELIEKELPGEVAYWTISEAVSYWLGLNPEINDRD